MKTRYRISQIVDCDGQGWIALIQGSAIVARFTSWTDARAAYRRATR